MSLEAGASLKEVVDKAEQIDADLQNKKQLIATAVTGKDVPTNGSDSFQKMADNIDSIKTKLPILEGDVGVTEDSKGDVYGVDKMEEREIYSENIENMITLEWQYSLSNISCVESDSFGNIYIGTNQKVIDIMKSSGDKKMYKYNQTGELLFERTFKYCYSKFIDSKGFIYVCQYSGGIVYKISPENQFLWTYTHSLTGNYVISDSNGNVYVNTDNTGYNKGMIISSSNGSLLSDLRVIGSEYTKLINGTRGNVFATNSTHIRKLMRGMIVSEYKISSSTIRKIDYEGLIYLSNSSSLIVLRDNYTLEKIAVLKEREVN